ncbi:hypothetical protein [Mycetocola reblochoni]|uniref:N-Acetyl-1-D-myo-Inosityl-2-Amino-2-Deoxy-alpha-D-Glucopyranoside Deacetylase mshB (GlcNAc-Ins deacetylase) n=1 Tax=Mycetocola reblochoni REB411 TaxID=1255698 RepID=A0A1R4IL81_9MICO|nr:hypothetical protein [Mycetocola reblochoni]SJN20640.1 N-Acetyl-1-D-myo-Inosityl-2-Amino-2-Deoxy-alpha-D-Glucopyranoside Deacetylase mshB (GlcNAc-Ins deacetylase) [Mycetocola reblochoni REB411]
MTPPSPAERPSARSRVLAAVVAAVLGVVFAAVGTVAHQITVSVWGITVYIGLFISLAAVAAVALACRLLLQGRLPSVLLAAGVIGTIGLFSVESAGGSVLIPAGVAGQVWVIGPTLLTAIVAVWPRVPAASSTSAARTSARSGAGS